MIRSSVCNAIIDSASIGIERGFMLDSWVFVADGKGVQGFGGFALGGIPGVACGNHAESQNIAAEWMIRIMIAAGVDSWDKLKGKSVRIQRESDEWNAKIIAIGHIVEDDRWFNPSETFEAWRASR